MSRLSILCLVLFLITASKADPFSNLEPVGTATLRVIFWALYDSTLFTPNGNYQGVEPGLTLQIDYRRKISRKDLINRTRDEWEKMDLYQQDSEQWINLLAEIWPDVQKGDQLAVQVTDSLGSNFYLNGEPAGTIQDSQFTHDFLAIFLSEKSSYPRLRNRLVGQSD